ncbi:DUF4160 domain-containing protein [Actinoplanes sp. NPDC026619]|uniref:DUF4160 domain-containing protein n=1 Tax=Actinoplanes sp. NPDC026619 TaxID=3155798 RepID=UPI0033DB4A2D
MPRLANVEGARISINYNDHSPPHVHVDTAETHGRVVIKTGEELPPGTFPRKGQRKILEWVTEHREALLLAWDDACAGEELRSLAEYVATAAGDGEPPALSATAGGVSR